MCYEHCEIDGKTVRKNKISMKRSNDEVKEKLFV